MIGKLGVWSWLSGVHTTRLLVFSGKNQDPMFLDFRQMKVRDTKDTLSNGSLQ